MSIMIEESGKDINKDKSIGSCWQCQRQSLAKLICKAINQ